MRCCHVHGINGSCFKARLCLRASVIGGWSVNNVTCVCGGGGGNQSRSHCSTITLFVFHIIFYYYVFHLLLFLWWLKRAICSSPDLEMQPDHSPCSFPALQHGAMVERELQQAAGCVCQTAGIRSCCENGLRAHICLQLISCDSASASFFKKVKWPQPQPSVNNKNYPSEYNHQPAGAFQHKDRKSV